MKTRLSHFFGSATVSVAVVLIILASGTLALQVHAANDYNIKLLVPPVTGDVEQVQLDPSQWSLTLTNFPNGVRRGSLEFIGSGGGSGAGIFAVWTNGVPATSGITTQNLIGAGGTSISATQFGSRVDITISTPTNTFLDASSTNGLVAQASLPVLSNAVAAVINATNNILQAEIAAKGTGNGDVFTESNNTYSAGTTQTMDAVTANVGTFTRGAIAGWNTNKSGFAVIVTRASDGSDTYNVDGTQVALLASNQTFTATNNFTGPTFLKGSTVISNSPTIVGNLSVTGTVTAANLSGALSGANIVGAGSVSTSVLGRVSNNSGTIGGAGNYLIVTFDPNTGLPIAWTTAAGPPAGASTNAVTFLENANNGSTFNNVNGIIFTNVPYFMQNQSTNTVGFSNVVFDTISLSQGGTNFVLHGATLSFTNANTQGGTISLNSSGTLVYGGSISNLLPGSGLPTSLSYSHTVADSGSGSGTLTVNAVGGDFYVVVTTNSTGQAVVFWLDGRRNFTFKPDAAGNATEMKIGMGLYGVANLEFDQGLGNPGLGLDGIPPHRAWMFDLGLPWTGAGGYVSTAEAANFIFDQFNVPSADSHKWYFMNNTNAPMVILKADGQQSTSATSAVQNSDWIGFQAWSSTNGLPRGSGVVLASNEDFFVVGFTRGMSTNCANASDNAYGYSTNATDHLTIRTNDFIGALNGANGLLGGSYTNVKGWAFRDDTNGLMVMSILTNGLYVGPTNNITQSLIHALP